MTLNEQFENAPIVYDNELHFKKNYESVADEFTIGFEEWMHDNCYYYSSLLYKMYGKGEEQFDLKQLLQIYKKEKGL
jgi:hypothetical protein